MKRVNMELPEELHTNAKVIAVLRNITMQQFIVDAIKAAVDRDKKLLDKFKKG